LRPTGTGGGATTVSANEILGRAAGSTTVTYTTALKRTFDFNATGSPTQAGTIGVQTSDQFTTSTGFGWLPGGTTGFDRTTAPGRTSVNFYRDGAAGNDGTFQVQVKPGTQYTVRVYMYDAAAQHDNIEVSIDGTVVLASTGVIPAATANIQLFTVTSNATGTMNIRFRDTGGQDASFAVNGIDVFIPGNDPGILPELATQVGSGTTVLTKAQLAPVVAAAIQRLTATG